MKNINLIIMMAVVLFFCSCAPQIIVSDKLFKISPGDELFTRAEKNFQTEAYDNALELYGEYLDRFPDRPLAPAAMLKIGAIYSRKGDHAKARDEYTKLIVKYPDSPFKPDAMVEILDIFYNEGKYNEVIQCAKEIPDNTLANIQLFRKYALAGDAFLAMGLTADAAYALATAHSKLEEPEDMKIIIKLKEAIPQLKTADILSLLSRVDDNQIKGYLMYQLGLNYAEEENFKDALEVLSKFLEMLPDHENTKKAKALIGEINQKTVYKRYAIGCLLPLSGPYKAIGDKALKGIELALGQFISQSINPFVKIIVKDTESDSNKAALAVKELSEDGVAAIIGPFITAETAASEAEVRRIPIITLTQKAHITGIGDCVFRNFLTPEMQVKAIVSYAVEALGASRLAILYPDENYGKVFLNHFWDEVLMYGGEVVGVESYSPDETDFADPIKKLVGLYYDIPEDLKALDVQSDNEENTDDKENAGEKDEPEAIVDFDAVFIPDSPLKASLIIPQLAYYDVANVYLLGTNLWHSPKLIELAKEDVQGAIMTEGFFPESALERVRNFVEVFETTFRERPGFIEAVSYDTAMILFNVVSREDIRFRSTLKNALKNLTDFPGVTGVTSFDQRGEAQKKLHLLQIRGEKFIELVNGG